MNQISLIEFADTFNLLSVSTVDLLEMEDRLETLEKLLKKLKKAKADQCLAECYISTLVNILRIECMKLLGELESAISDPKKEYLKEEIDGGFKAIKEFIKRIEYVDKNFKPYLFCPAELRV